MHFQTIRDIKNLKGKKILLRLDLNSPIVNGAIRDDFRIKRSMPTLNFLRDNGAKTIIISHIESAETRSLKAVSDYLTNYINVSFANDCFSTETKNMISSLKEGDFLLLENIRNYEGEEKNSEHFAKQLASLGEI